MNTLHEEKQVKDPWWDNLSESQYQETFRMSKCTVIDLQAEIDHAEDVHLNRIDKMLLICLCFLGSTKSFEELELVFKIRNCKNAIKNYLLKILKLGSSYVLWPTEKESICIANGFSKECQFPGVLGVLGSLHIEVNVADENNAGVYYNNIMEKHTIILQVVCDNNLLLRDVCAGCPGGKTIKEILELSPLYPIITDKESVLIKNNLHLLGGTEHPQLPNLLTPYKFNSGENLTLRQRQFNLLHSAVMCTVEKTFRCLELRFPRLTSVDDLTPEFSSLIASSVCVLHNFTRVRADNCELYM